MDNDEDLIQEHEDLLCCTACLLRQREDEVQRLRMDNFVLKCLAGSLALFSFALTLAVAVG